MGTPADGSHREPGVGGTTHRGRTDRRGNPLQGSGRPGSAAPGREGAQRREACVWTAGSVSQTVQAKTPLQSTCAPTETNLNRKKYDRVGRFYAASLMPTILVLQEFSFAFLQDGMELPPRLEKAKSSSVCKLQLKWASVWWRQLPAERKAFKEPIRWNIKWIDHKEVLKFLQGVQNDCEKEMIQKRREWCVSFITQVWPSRWKAHVPHQKTAVNSSFPFWAVHPGTVHVSISCLQILPNLNF